MMLSDVAVRRPVFAAVAAIVLCVIGISAFFFLPVRELPDVDPPIVSINTSYAGASAEVIENRITEPIEQQIAGIQGVERIESTSRDGRSNVRIEFSLDRDIDGAANDVRDRISRVVGRLPDQADPPEVAKADTDSQPIMILFLRSTAMNRLELTDYADRYRPSCHGARSRARPDLWRAALCDADLAGRGGSECPWADGDGR